MKKKRLFLGLLAIAAFSWQFSIEPKPAIDQQRQLIDSLTTRFHLQLDALITEIDGYQASCQSARQIDTSYQQLREAHYATRLAFKRVSFLLEFNDPFSIKKSLNGPPLPSLEPNVPMVNVLAPQGLQVLDELLHEEGPLPLEDIDSFVNILRKEASQIVAYQKNIPLTHRHFFEASQQELLRIFTLGLTGFDTPGSLNAIPEAAASLRSMYEYLSYYRPLLSGSTSPLAEKLNSLFPEAIATLEAHDDFNSFDRLSFYRNHLAPLRSLVWEIQNNLGVESEHELSNIPLPLSGGKYDLFDIRFFNLSYYRKFADDSLLDKKIALGRLLFYDPVLSQNNQRACASCHNPALAFSDGRAKSLAYDGNSSLQRNAPGLFNVILAERFFYDLREPRIDRQFKHVVLSEDEFNTDFLQIAEKLNLSQEYQQLFHQSYPESGISQYSISNALTAYLSALTSFDSPFDRYARAETDVLAEDVKRGFNLFMGKAACGTCHFAPTFSGLVPPLYIENESEVLGVPIHPNAAVIDPDWGRIASGRPTDEAPHLLYSFKTTTVRNVALTAPYMHNGAYKNLEEVMDFYNRGGGNGLGILLENQTLSGDPLELTDAEQRDIIAFMKSLTDTSRTGSPPKTLPGFDNQPQWNSRPVGGVY